MNDRKFDYSLAKHNGNEFLGNVLIEYGAKIGKNNHFANNCTICSNCTIGNDNIFEVGVTIGSPSRERIMGSVKPKHITDYPVIEIGNHNLFENSASVQTPLESITKVSNYVSVGAFSLIAHDSILMDDVTTASHCSIGGYSIIHVGANLGIGSSVHQRTVVGAFAMIGAGTVIINHIAPAATVIGVPNQYLKINKLGLERNGYIESTICLIEDWHQGIVSVDKLPKDFVNHINAFYGSLEIWGRKRPIIPLEMR